MPSDNVRVVITGRIKIKKNKRLVRKDGEKRTPTILETIMLDERRIRMKQSLSMTHPLYEKYLELLKQYSSIDDSQTLAKYKILKEAYSLGIQLYGNSYTQSRLSDELDVPYTTVKRIMSLSKANKLTWKKIKQKKISVFRVAYILSTKDVTYQDEIIDMCIEKGLSTYDIKKMRINDYKDVEKARLQIAVEKGFARKDTAYLSLKRSIDRLYTLLDLSKEDLPEKKLVQINQKLINLKNKIDKFITKLK